MSNVHITPDNVRYEDGYLNLKFETVLAELQEYVRKYTETNDFEMSTLESNFHTLIAGIAEMMSVYTDLNVLECFLTTATQPTSINRLIRGINYFIPETETSSISVTLTRQPEIKDITNYTIRKSDPISIPKNTIWQAGDILFYNENEIRLPSNEDKVTFPLVQGVIKTLEYKREDIQDYRIFLPYQRDQIDFSRVTIDNLERVDDALIEMEGGKKFSLHTTDSGSVYILTTFDYDTCYPSTLRIHYSVTRTHDGEIEEDAEVKCLGTWYDYTKDDDVEVDQRQVVLTHTNSSKAYNLEDVDWDYHRSNARYQLQTGPSIVTRQDFMTHALKQSHVKEATVSDWRASETSTKRGVACPPLVVQPYTASAWVMTDFGREIPDYWLNDMVKYFNEKALYTCEFNVYGPDFVDFDYDIRLSFASGTTASEKEVICEDVKRWLDNNYTYQAYLRGSHSNIGFGQSAYHDVIKAAIYRLDSRITDVITNYQGVQNLDLIQVAWYTFKVTEAVPN